ncbi:unnamed protein product [Vicia faba]|uniref:Uncharacterized protein n=1 Tax=Vicia faba TaxID=3906 RepID=A0AAV0Z1S7_VICFA|nr:unnamed protein product [Vicia faba]
MKFFQDLPFVVFVGNPDLCINNECRASKSLEGNKSIRNIIIYTLLGVILTSAVVTCGVILALRIQGDNSYGRNNFDEVEMEWPFILFQKFNFNINDIVSKLSDSNIVIKGCSDVVYRVETLTLLQVNVVKGI